MTLLAGRTALITGGAQGIGYAIAETLHASGANVVLADLNLELATEAAARLSQQGAKASAVRCDVTSEDDVKAALAETGERHGRVDVMVNNAGITRDKTMRTMTAEDFRAVIDVHLYGAWLGTKYASLVMREQGAGSIVNISSISGKVGMIGQRILDAKLAEIPMGRAGEPGEVASVVLFLASDLSSYVTGTVIE